jgi:hypothetical protein
VRLCVCLGVIVWRLVLTDGLLTDLVVTGLTDAGQTLCVVAGGDLTIMVALESDHVAVM